jgi:hypothetical protein
MSTNGDTRDNTIGVRLTDDELERLRWAANRQGLSTSELVRRGMVAALGDGDGEQPASDEIVIAPSTPLLVREIRVRTVGDVGASAVRVCPGCGMPRDPNPPDLVFDSLAHAQCDQNVAALERNAK